jgi:hypothetical protein
VRIRVGIRDLFEVAVGLDETFLDAGFVQDVVDYLMHLAIPIELMGSVNAANDLDNESVLIVGALPGFLLGVHSGQQTDLGELLLRSPAEGLQIHLTVLLGGHPPQGTIPNGQNIMIV